MTVSEYLLFCKKSGLSLIEMESMTIGACLDHIEEYFVSMHPKLRAPQQATQDDIQRLKGR